MDLAIRITGLRVEYPAPGGGSLTVAAMPELSVQRGEAIAVVGRSGSGKTTLLNVLAGIVRPSAGSVQVLGHALQDLSEERRDYFRLVHVGYVHQQFNLLPGFTALENVMLPGAFVRGSQQGAVETTARALLTQMGLGDRVDHRPGQLSGGEQQRVAVARALVLSPGLLLLDEPTANLDSQTSRAVVDLLQDVWRQRRVTIVVATHDESLIDQFDRCIEMEPTHGRETDDAAGNRLAQPAFKAPA